MPSTDFKTVLQNAMLEKNITTAQLAEQTWLSVEYLKKIVSGEFPPNQRVLRLLSQIFPDKANYFNKETI